MSRQELEQLYDQLFDRYEAGDITIDQFRTEMVRAKIQDSAGRFWTINPELGSWEVNPGGAWIEATPPDDFSAPAEGDVPAPAAEDVPPGAPKKKAQVLSRQQLLILAVLFVLILVVFGAFAAAVTGMLRLPL
ncbi:MAG: hypothetical protein JXD18_04015 [Anaerolineae bacterium]|nr:hypothetical protein [Anaerolineae bacterium]